MTFVRTLFALSFAHEEVFGVGRHVEAQREGEVGVDLLLHHGHHVEGVSHGVETEDPRQLLETRSAEGDSVTEGDLTIYLTGLNIILQTELKSLLTFSLRGPSCHTGSRCTCCRPPTCL